MTKQTKMILAAPGFPIQLILFALILVLALIHDTYEWIRYFLWLEFIKPILTEQWHCYLRNFGILSYEELKSTSNDS